MTEAKPLVIYLHGFLSSPGSAKGRELREEALASGWNFLAPDLNLSPREVDRLLTGLMDSISEERRVRTLVLGSSLGGFYALRLANRFALTAATVNPCLNPWEFVAGQTGEREVYGTGRKVFVMDAFAGELLALSREVPPRPRDPADALTLLSTADEVLDYRLARKALMESPAILSVGDDHRMQRFARYLPHVRAFFERRMAAKVRAQ